MGGLEFQEDHQKCEKSENMEGTKKGKKATSKTEVNKMIPDDMIVTTTAY
jgi:hypothetical protein